MMMMPTSRRAWTTYRWLVVGGYTGSGLAAGRHLQSNPGDCKSLRIGGGG